MNIAFNCQIFLNLKKEISDGLVFYPKLDPQLHPLLPLRRTALRKQTIKTCQHVSPQKPSHRAGAELTQHLNRKELVSPRLSNTWIHGIMPCERGELRSPVLDLRGLLSSLAWTLSMDVFHPRHRGFPKTDASVCLASGGKHSELCFPDGKSREAN